MNERANKQVSSWQWPTRNARSKAKKSHSQCDRVQERALKEKYLSRTHELQAHLVLEWVVGRDGMWSSSRRALPVGGAGHAFLDLIRTTPEIQKLSEESPCSRPGAVRLSKTQSSSQHSVGRRNSMLLRL